MAHGTTYCYTEDLCRRFNSICLQEKSHSRSSWPWWTHTQYNHLHFRKQRNQKPLLQNIPVPDSLERGLPAGRLTRREYQICLLEARYSCTFRGDFAESQKHSECSDQDVRCESSRSFFGDQSVTPRVGASKTGFAGSEATRHCDRQTSNDTICRSVLQSVGSDLIAPWLTPAELHNAERAFFCSWDWGQAWHWGRVRNKALASRIEYLLPTHGTEYLIDFYETDDVFSALWHLLPVNDFELLAVRYNHLKSIRRIIHLRG